MEATAHAPADRATIPAYIHTSGAAADSMTKAGSMARRRPPP